MERRLNGEVSFVLCTFKIAVLFDLHQIPIVFTMTYRLRVHVYLLSMTITICFSLCPYPKIKIVNSISSFNQCLPNITYHKYTNISGMLQNFSIESHIFTIEHKMLENTKSGFDHSHKHVCGQKQFFFPQTIQTKPFSPEFVYFTNAPQCSAL